MSNSFFVPFERLILFFIAVVIFLCCFFIPAIYAGQFPDDGSDVNYSFTLNASKYLWPTPGYTSINSYFGKRYSPTAGASSYHKGVDIGAPQGTNLLAVVSGKITFAQFLGGGGYTITLTNGNMKFTYCHVSPNFLVSVGDSLVDGQVIGQVGPKYVYDVIGNPYHDSTGKPTNGATTGCHLHITFKVDGNTVNPLNYIDV